MILSFSGGAKGFLILDGSSRFLINKNMSNVEKQILAQLLHLAALPLILMYESFTRRSDHLSDRIVASRFRSGLGSDDP